MNAISNKLSRFLGNSLSGHKTAILGERELEVMKILWQDQPLSARQVLERTADAHLSLSTMQTTLERLYRKNLLSREKSGRYYVYHTTMSRSEMISLLLKDISDQVCDGDMDSMVSGFSRFFVKKSTQFKADE